MSTALEAASLIMIPNSYSDGLLASVKPNDGAGDFTFSRGSNLSATRVNADGYIEKGRENIVLYSNKFDESYWQKLSGCSILGQTATDPFGVANNAWLVNFDGTTNGRLEKQVSGSQVKTMSIYVRTQSGTQDVIIGFGGNELVTKTITTTWQRIEKFTPDNIYPRLRCDSATTLEVFGFQVELGLVATPYIETGASTGKSGILEDMPRIDFSGGNQSLLLERSRTNLIANSEYLNGISWSGKIGVSFDTNTTTSPEGLDNASLLKEDSSNGSHFAYKDFSLTSGSTYTISIFAKSNGANRNLRFGDGGLGWSSGFNGVFNLTAGTATGGTIEPMGSGWYRCSVTGTANATTCRLIIYSSLNTSTSYQGDGTSGAYLYGFQIEEGFYPTSYIPTYGVSQTRLKDGGTAGDISSIVNSPEGTIFTEFAKIGDFDSFQLDDSTQNNRITLYPRNDTQTITFIFTINGVEVIRENPRPTGLDTTAFNKYAIAWGLNDFRVYVNGLNIYTSTSNITFGSGIIYDLDLTGANHKQFLLFPTALSDEECITLTTI